MDKKILTNLISVVFIATFMSNSASAGDTGLTTISQFEPWNTGFYVKVANGNNNPEGCMASTWLYLGNDDPNYALIASATLSAFTSGTEVIIYGDGCDGDYSEVKGIRLHN